MRQNPHVRICGGPGSATTLVYPTPDGRVVGLQTTLAEQLFDIAERERVPEIPAYGA